MELSEYLIESANVAVVTGSAFGSKGYSTIYATSLECIKEAVGKNLEIIVLTIQLASRLQLNLLPGSSVGRAIDC